MKPLLVGMHNPISSVDAHALYPLPDGCTGNRIWHMINLHRKMTHSEYIDAYDRCNLVCGKIWSARAARVAVPALLERIKGRRVVLFGDELRTLLKLEDLPLRPQMAWEAELFCAPHPSGRNR
jgi:hypothetical protein